MSADRFKRLGHLDFSGEAGHYGDPVGLVVALVVVLILLRLFHVI